MPDGSDSARAESAWWLATSRPGGWGRFGSGSRGPTTATMVGVGWLLLDVRHAIRQLPARIDPMDVLREA